MITKETEVWTVMAGKGQTQRPVNFMLGDLHYGQAVRKISNSTLFIVSLNHGQAVEKIYHCTVFIPQYLFHSFYSKVFIPQYLLPAWSQTCQSAEGVEKKHGMHASNSLDKNQIPVDHCGDERFCFNAQQFV